MIEDIIIIPVTGGAKINAVEIRLFGLLKKLADERGWPFPYYFELNEECSARELAELLDIPADQIEGVIVNGTAKPLDEGRIKPGSRVGFVPYGIPGPYRVLLGYKKIKKK